MVNEVIFSGIGEWRVLEEEEIMSDHRYICVAMGTSARNIPFSNGR